MDHTYRLAYIESTDLLLEIDYINLRARDRVTVHIESGGDYVFIYMGTVGDQITGISALNHRQVVLDLETMSLVEHAPE